MKRNYCIYILIGFMLFITGYASLGNIKGSQSTSVANVDKTIVPVTEFANLLDKSIKVIRTSDRHDNFILFVHGRGKHPEKAYKKSLIKALESDYSAKVIMFHWPSWEGSSNFPEGKARDSAIDFSLVLMLLKKYRQDNQQLTSDIKFTLLTHSMGSIVREEFSMKNDGSLRNLFDTVVISASASAAKNHSNWVENINLSNNLYITINNNDQILGRAGLKMKGMRLGKWNNKDSENRFKLAKNAKYIDLTESSLGHRYYIYRDLNHRPIAKSFFDKVLNGIPATLGRGKETREIKRDRIYILKRHSTDP